MPRTVENECVGAKSWKTLQPNRLPYYGFSCSRSRRHSCSRSRSVTVVHVLLVTTGILAVCRYGGFHPGKHVHQRNLGHWQYGRIQRSFAQSVWPLPRHDILPSPPSIKEAFVCGWGEQLRAPVWGIRSFVEAQLPGFLPQSGWIGGGHSNVPSDVPVSFQKLSFQGC